MNALSRPPMHISIYRVTGCELWTHLPRILVMVALAVFSSFAGTAQGQSVVRIGAVAAERGPSIVVPITLEQSLGSKLHASNGPGSTIQAVSLRVKFSPSSSIAGATFRRAGATSARRPALERAFTSPDGPVLLVQFNEMADPLRFSALGQEVIAELLVTPGAAVSGSIGIAFDRSACELTNSSGTISESVQSGTLEFNDATLLVGSAAVGKTLSVIPDPPRTPPSSPPRSKVSDAVLQDIDAAGWADVIVQIADPVAENAPNDLREVAIARAQRAVLDRLAATDYAVRAAFIYTPGIGLRINRTALNALSANRDVTYIGPNAKGKVSSLCDTRTLIGAATLQTPPPGLDGGGSGDQTRPHRIAILDGGYSWDQPMITGSTNHLDQTRSVIFAEQCGIPAYYAPCHTLTTADQPCYPRSGCTTHPAGTNDSQHGSWVTGVVASNESCTAHDGYTAGENPKGIAPGADIVSIQVLAANQDASLDGVVAALDWIRNKQSELNVDVVSMSFYFEKSRGVPYEYSTRDDCDKDSVFTSLRQSIKALRDTGVVFFHAAGNEGSKQAVFAPGCFTDRTLSNGTLSSGGSSTVLSAAAAYDADYGPPQPRQTSALYFLSASQYPQPECTFDPFYPNDNAPWSWFCHQGSIFPHVQDDGSAGALTGRVTGFSNVAKRYVSSIDNLSRGMTDLVVPATFQTLPDRRINSYPRTTTASGTSFSAPAAAAGAAIVDQARPPVASQQRYGLLKPCEIEGIMKFDNQSVAVEPAIAPGSDPSGPYNQFPRLNLSNLVSAARAVRGDANGDTAIDQHDIDFLIDFLYTYGRRPTYVGGNANRDCIISSADIFYLNNYFCCGGPPPRQ